MSKQRAQAATELAVFGAILIFVIGAIIRSGIQSGLDQNQTLKAMRWALNQSMRGVRNENKSRDSANLLVIEDRLSPDPSKFGSLERIPMIQAGSGTFTNNLFLPMDWNETWNIPVMDVFVNTVHFVFTTGKFIIYDIEEVGDQIRIWDLTNNKLQKTVAKVEGKNWKSKCTKDINGADVGCPVFFTIVPANSVDFCADELSCDNSVINFSERFDLNLNFIADDDPPADGRKNILWQWKPIAGLAKNIEINSGDGVYQSYDVDYDRKEEVIYGVNMPGPVTWPPLLHEDVVQRIAVFDPQKGDLNMTQDDADVYNTPSGINTVMGLQRDVSVYTMTKEGTYLQIKQGKAFIPETGNFVRSVNRKDQIDVISRQFQLSNNTGNFCVSDNTRAEFMGDPILKMPNPVEACVNSGNGHGNCLTPITVSQTCFDAKDNMLYIRSRIQERRGHKWVTQIED